MLENILQMIREFGQQQVVENPTSQTKTIML
jgi:hypothetical protein